MEATTPHFFNDCLNLDGDPIMGDESSSAYSIPTTCAFPGGPSVWSQAQDAAIDPAFSYFDESFGSGHEEGYADREQLSASSTTTPTTQFSTVTKQSAISSSTSVSSKSSGEESKPKAKKPSKKKKTTRTTAAAAAVAAAITTITTTASSTAGVAKSRARSVSTSKSEEDPKRNKFLERNRIAAYKCRQKKKEWVSELEEKTKGLEAKHTTLQHEFNTLATEISEMKNQLMAHAACHDPNISRWIENEARRFVQNDSRRISHGSVISSICDFFDTPQAYVRSASVSSTSPISPTFDYDQLPDALFDPAMTMPKVEQED